MQTHSSTDQGQRVLKTWENGFPHSQIWASYLSRFKHAVQKKTINSTLKFSVRWRVKLWDNCLDLINKRNGSNSWPCTGERQLETIIWIDSHSTITDPSELSAQQEKKKKKNRLTRIKTSFFPSSHECSQIYENFFFTKCSTLMTEALTSVIKLVQLLFRG